MADLISAGEISGGLVLLINDTGHVILRAGGQSVEADPAKLAAALARVKPVAELAARSGTPISGMSGPVERSLAHFGCSRLNSSTEEK